MFTLAMGSLTNIVFFLGFNLLKISGSFAFNDSELNYLSEVQRSFCPTSDICLSGVSTINTSSYSPENLPVRPSDHILGPCCGDCSCNINTCDVTDSCCLETLDDVAFQEQTTIRMTCEYPQLRPYLEKVYPNQDSPRLMFRKCPNLHDVSKETLDKCENPDMYEDIGTKLPVTDAKTSYIYQNRYCAHCNNVPEDDLHYWDAKVECKHGVLFPQNMKHIVKEVVDSKSCNIKYHPSLPGPLYKCSLMLISKCNETGHWRKYDPLVEAACLAFATTFNFKYKNVFCYLCNTDDTVGPDFCYDDPREHIFPDFSALLKLTPLETVTESSTMDGCQRDQLFDPILGTCRDLECIFPKTLENGTCVNVAENIGGVGFGIFLRLSPYEDINPSDNDLIDDVVRSLRFYFTNWLTHPLQYEGNLFLYIYERHNTSTVPFDNTVYPIETFVLYLEMATAVFRPESPSVIDYMMSIHNSSVDITLPFAKSLKYHVLVDVNDEESIDDSTLNDSLLGTFNRIAKYEGMSYQAVAGKIMVNMLSICPSIHISSEEYPMVQYSHGTYIKAFDTIVSKNEILVEDDSAGKSFTVRICADVFESLIESSAATQIFSHCEESFSTLGIVSNVCSIVSISFSAITLLVYLLLKDLKTQPGINNILLCIFLITAQALFQFGSGQSCNVSVLACQIIGILVHFSWLLVINWMTVCCIHMFRVFKCNQHKISTFNTSKTSIMYIFYCVLVSAIPVLVNIGLALSKSHGNDFGYGGTMCYIHDRYMVAYVFALPVGVTVFVNIVLYSLVVFQIKSTRKIQNDKDGKMFLKIYTRLSTLTGGTWIFGFLGFFLDVPSLDYIFVLLNATQGLFLFFAFVANRRILLLLKGKMTSQSEGSTRAMKYSENKERVETSS